MELWQGLEQSGQLDMIVEIQPLSLETNSTIIISCFSQDQRTPIACQYKWFRAKDSNVQLLNNTSNSYQCSPYDLGYKFSVTITSATECKEVEIGTICMDYLLRKDVCQIIEQGCANFVVSVSEEDYVIDLQHKRMVFIHTGTEKESQFPYQGIELRVMTKQSIVLPEEWKGLGEGEIRFKNRTIRDLFLFAYRGLSIKSGLGSMYVLHAMSNLELVKGERFQYLMEIEELKRDIVQWKRINKKFKSQKQEIQSENIALKEQILNLKSSLSSQPQIESPVPSLALSTLSAQNNTLKQQIKRYKKKQQQMKTVIQYLQQYRDKVKASTTITSNGSVQQNLVKYKMRGEELKIENEFLFKEKERINKELKGVRSSCELLEAKYKRTLEIIDENGEMVEGLQKEVGKYQKLLGEREREKGDKGETPGEDNTNFRKKYEKLAQQYQILKRGYDAVNRSRDLSLAASLIDQSHTSYNQLYYDKSL